MLAPTAGAPPAPPKTRVRGLGVLELPRVGVPAAVFPDRRWRNGASYDDIASGPTQFLSRDPAVAATRSPYGYVGGNPLNGVDPTGLDCGPLSFVCDPVESVAGGVASQTTSWAGDVKNQAESWSGDIRNWGSEQVQDFNQGVDYISQPIRIGPEITSAKNIMCIVPGTQLACAIIDTDRALRGSGSWLAVGGDVIAGALGPFGSSSEFGFALGVNLSNYIWKTAIGNACDRLGLPDWLRNELRKLAR